MAKFSDTWYGNEFFDCFSLETLYIAKGAPFHTNGTWARQTVARCDSLVIYGCGTGNKLSRMASEMGKEYVNIEGGTTKVLEVTFADVEVSIKKGSSKNVNAFVYPETTTSKTLQYTSSNTDGKVFDATEDKVG